MARQARIVVPGVAHHVTQRGNYRQDVFFTDDDRRVYLAYLRESAQLHGLAVSAYCLMTNHVHLVVTPEREESLAKTMGRTHLMYAQYIHRLHGRLGHLWQSRFYSCPMDDAYAHNAAAYVELNPMDARWHGGIGVGLCLVQRGRPLRLPRRPPALAGLLDLGAWFEEVSAVRWKATLTAIADCGPEVDRLRLHTRTGRPLGSDSFLSKVETYLGRRVRAIPRGHPYGSKDRVRRKRR